MTIMMLSTLVVDVMLSIWAESVAPVCYSSLSWYPNPYAINNAGTWVILRAVMAPATAVSAVFFSISDIFSFVPHVFSAVSTVFNSIQWPTLVLCIANILSSISNVLPPVSNIFSSIPHILGSISANFFSAHGLCADW